VKKKYWKFDATTHICSELRKEELGEYASPVMSANNLADDERLKKG
jgi:hypothetical protein